MGCNVEVSATAYAEVGTTATYVFYRWYSGNTDNVPLSTSSILLKGGKSYGGQVDVQTVFGQKGHFTFDTIR